MTREVRTLFLGILTLVIYALSIFLSKGAFIFPLPLNEFAFLAIATYFFILNWKGNKWAGLLAVATGVCAVMGTQFFWTFLYDQEEMVEFTNGLTIDYCLLAFYSLILIGGVATMVKQGRGVTVYFSVLFILAFVSAVILNHSLLLLLAYASMIASTQIKKVYAPYHLLWVLLFALKLTEWLTFTLNG